MFIKYLLGLVLTTFVMFAGCAAQSKLESPGALCLAGGDVETVMAQCEKALAKMDFRIEKFDPDLGIIISKPLEGGQFFEFWRKDNANSYESGLSNLHSIRRAVELKVREDNGQACVDCKVMISKLSMPERETVNTGKAYSMISNSSENRPGFIVEKDQLEKTKWIKLRRDPALEIKILERIEKEILSKK